MAALAGSAVKGSWRLHPQGSDVRDFAKANHSNWTLSEGDPRYVIYFISSRGWFDLKRHARFSDGIDFNSRRSIGEGGFDCELNVFEAEGCRFYLFVKEKQNESKSN